MIDNKVKLNRLNNILEVEKLGQRLELTLSGQLVLFASIGHYLDNQKDLKDVPRATFFEPFEML